MGDVMGDLQGRRAMIMGMSSEAGYEKLSAKVPLKEMASYSTALSFFDRRTCFVHHEFASYELVPSDVQDKLVKEFEAKQARRIKDFTSSCFYNLLKPVTPSERGVMVLF